MHLGQKVPPLPMAREERTACQPSPAAHPHFHHCVCSPSLEASPCLCLQTWWPEFWLSWPGFRGPFTAQDLGESSCL